MDAKECAGVLRSFITHRERMIQNLYKLESDGTERKVDPANDVVLPALRFALTCVEKSNGCGAE